MLRKERKTLPDMRAPINPFVAAWPLVVGITRLYRDRHWASDVLAGWVAGTAVAATSALLYESLKARSAE